jgi:hypothetical protein
MKKTAIVLIIGLVTLASATCFVALAEPPGPPPGPPPHGPGFFGGPPGPPPGPPPFGLLFGPPDLIEKLKLTDDQLKEMRLAYVDFQDKTRKARTALMGLHDEKKAMLISGKIDQAKLAKCDEEITKLASEVMAVDLKMKREQFSKLTAEQMNLLANFLGKMEMARGPKMARR